MEEIGEKSAAEKSISKMESVFQQKRMVQNKTLDKT